MINSKCARFSYITIETLKRPSRSRNSILQWIFTRENRVLITRTIWRVTTAWRGRRVHHDVSQPTGFDIGDLPIKLRLNGDISCKRVKCGRHLRFVTRFAMMLWIDILSYACLRQFQRLHRSATCYWPTGQEYIPSWETRQMFLARKLSFFFFYFLSTSFFLFIYVICQTLIIASLI